MNKYNQLREEIIKAVPEIMELKRGCRIYDKMKDRYGIYKGEGGLVNCEIIGRDITLEDCLIASRKKRQKLDEIVDWKEREKKINIWAENNEILIQLEWELGKPLQDQSDECKELLWDLICKK